MYDAIVVLGLKLAQDWTIEDDLKSRLDHAANMFNANQTKQIIVTGKWSIWFDWLQITPPVTEADTMKLYLESKGIPTYAIRVESNSKDTIGNIYELSLILQKDLYKRIAIICADQLLARVKFLSETFLSSATNVSYIPLRSPHFDQNTTGDEATIFAEQQKVVTDILDTLNADPNYELYSHPYYTKQAHQVQELINSI